MTLFTDSYVNLAEGGQTMQKKTSYRKYIVPFLLLLFASLLRLVSLDQIPLDMHIDEAGLGLNAWSIAQFGTDRYGNFLPVCPSNFYGEQSAFYTYFTALLVKMFGLSLFTLRLPAVVMGLVSVLFGALILKEKWGARGFYLGLVLFSVFPYFIINSRFALDCNAMLGTFTVSLYGLIRLIKALKLHPDDPHYGWFALVGVLFGIVLYTYIIAAVAVGIFCVFYGLWYLFYKKENRIRRLLQLLCWAIPLLVMAVPLILVFCVNYFDLEPITTPFFTVPKMLVNRTQEVNLATVSIFGKLKSFTHIFTTDGKYGSSERFWTLYPISIPFVLVGGVVSIFRFIDDLRKKRLSIDFVLLTATLAETVLFFLCGLYNYHINGIFVALGYFCINGILSVFDWIKNRANKWPAYAFFAVLSGIYLISVIGFGISYFGADTENAYMVYGGVSEAISLLPAEKQTSDIYVLDEVGEIYFLSHPQSPNDFECWYDENGLIPDYHNLHFHDPEDYREGDVIICNRANPRYLNYVQDASDETIYSLTLTEHYCVFYKK